LWQDYQYNNIPQGMAVGPQLDLRGGSCVIGCQTENNIAVVGKQGYQPRMHWMRIDRYYSSDHHKRMSLRR
jgi:molybdopterin-containing oxidoreductase family iron-sulfur binding subunit